jgi:hypothetical protein
MALTAVLLNPVLHDRRTISERNVGVAAAILGLQSVVIANMHGTPTRDLPALALIARDRGGWEASRGQLAEALTNNEVLLFAWGVGGLVGPAREHLRLQERWVVDAALRAGHEVALMLDGRPRHPSRWRQYLGQQHGRFAHCGTFDDRLRAALQPVPLRRRHCAGPAVRAIPASSTR